MSKSVHVKKEGPSRKMTSATPVEQDSVEVNDDECEASGSSSGNARKTNAFREDDKNDINVIVKGLEGVLKCVGDIADAHMPSFSGGGLKKEKKSTLRKYHKVAVDVVGTKLKVETLPEVVDKVYEEFAGRLEAEKDDEKFFAMLEEFEEKCEKEAKKHLKSFTMDEIDQDEGYQECLEVFHKYADDGNQAKDKSAGDSFFTDKASAVGSATSGLEPLTEYIPTRDPLTMKYLRDPYINRICGHVYEFESIVEMIRGGGDIRCPYPVCDNKKMLTELDLFKDHVIAKKIADRVHVEEIGVDE